MWACLVSRVALEKISMPAYRIGYSFKITDCHRLGRLFRMQQIDSLADLKSSDQKSPLVLSGVYQE